MSLLYSAFVLAQDRNWDYGHMDIGGGWWIVMMIGMALFWVLVVVGIVWLVRSLQHDAGSRGGREPRPLEVLDHRLAAGSITVEEYEQRRGVLRGSLADGDEG